MIKANPLKNGDAKLKGLNSITSINGCMEHASQLPGGIDIISQASKFNLKEQTNDFHSLLRNYPDHPKFTILYTYYLKRLLHNFNNSSDEVVLPIMEIMTVIKHERPIIHSLLCKIPDGTISMLAHISTDISVAKHRLNNIATVKTPI